MRNAILFLIVMVLSLNSIGQTISYPDVDRKTQQDVYIKSVSITSYYTEIVFIYKNSTSTGHYIHLNLPGNANAFFIRADNQIYNLLSTQNIANYTGVTAAMPGKPVEFSARFERIPSYTTKFDLIEGVNGSWDFYGVQLKAVETQKTAEKFRLDYNYIAIYDPTSETWGEWTPGDNTFVINVNDKGDVAHLKANGETVIYKILSSAEEGYTETGNQHYQMIKALDEDGDVISIQLFDDPSVGLKLIWGQFMVQFASF